jgi:hypothetical protein
MSSAQQHAPPIKLVSYFSLSYIGKGFALSGDWGAAMPHNRLVDNYLIHDPLVDNYIIHNALVSTSNFLHTIEQSKTLILRIVKPIISPCLGGIYIATNS